MILYKKIWTKKNIFYRLYRKIKKTLIARIFGNNFIYKYFPKIFLWAKFSLLNNKNTEDYWNQEHSKEETITPNVRFENLVLSFLDRLDFSNKDILDVGCGRGIFLSQIKNARSLNGIDISSEAVKICESKGINAKKRTLPNLNLQETFDIITCFETLEHTYYWRESIREMIKKLRPDGFLAISVPFENSILTKEHVSYFDIPRLYGFLKNKLSVLEIKILGP